MERRVITLGEVKAEVTVIAFELLLPVENPHPDPNKYSKDEIHQLSKPYLSILMMGRHGEYIAHIITSWISSKDPGKLNVRGRLIIGGLPEYIPPHPRRSHLI